MCGGSKGNILMIFIVQDVSTCVQVEVVVEEEAVGLAETLSMDASFINHLGSPLTLVVLKILVKMGATLVTMATPLYIFPVSL